MKNRDYKLQEILNRMIPILKDLDDYKDIISLEVTRVDDYFCWVIGSFESGRKFYAPVHTESISSAFRDVISRLDCNHIYPPSIGPNIDKSTR